MKWLTFEEADKTNACFCGGRWGVTLYATGPSMIVEPECMIEQTGYDFDTWEDAARFAHRFFDPCEQMTSVDKELVVEGVTVALLEHCCQHLYDTTWMVLRGTQ